MSVTMGNGGNKTLTSTNFSGSYTGLVLTPLLNLVGPGILQYAFIKNAIDACSYEIDIDGVNVSNGSGLNFGTGSNLCTSFPYYFSKSCVVKGCSSTGGTAATTGSFTVAK